jgi:hypothetical protein
MPLQIVVVFFLPADPWAIQILGVFEHVYKTEGFYIRTQKA